VQEGEREGPKSLLTGEESEKEDQACRKVRNLAGRMSSRPWGTRGKGKILLRPKCIGHTPVESSTGGEAGVQFQLWRQIMACHPKKKKPRAASTEGRRGQSLAVVRPKPFQGPEGKRSCITKGQWREEGVDRGGRLIDKRLFSGGIGVKAARLSSVMGGEESSTKKTESQSIWGLVGKGKIFGLAIDPEQKKESD